MTRLIALLLIAASCFGQEISGGGGAGGGGGGGGAALNNDRIALMAGAVPEAGNDAWVGKLTTYATNDPFDTVVYIFENTSTKDCFSIKPAQVPQYFGDNASFVIIWASDDTSGDVVWDIDYRAVGGNDLESIDQSGAQESITGTDTAGSAAWERMELNIAATDSNFAAGDTLFANVCRDGAASDTLADRVFIIDAYFEFDHSE